MNQTLTNLSPKNLVGSLEFFDKRRVFELSRLYNSDKAFHPNGIPIEKANWQKWLRNKSVGVHKFEQKHQGGVLPCFFSEHLSS